jgi:hypothetical protein
MDWKYDGSLLEQPMRPAFDHNLWQHAYAIRQRFGLSEVKLYRLAAMGLIRTWMRPARETGRRHRIYYSVLDVTKHLEQCGQGTGKPKMPA